MPFHHSLSTIRKRISNERHCFHGKYFIPFTQGKETILLWLFKISWKIFRTQIYNLILAKLAQTWKKTKQRSQLSKGLAPLYIFFLYAYIYELCFFYYFCLQDAHNLIEKLFVLSYDKHVYLGVTLMVKLYLADHAASQVIKHAYVWESCKYLLTAY